MKKSNWIIIAVLVVLSAFLLWLWYFFRFNLIDEPLDLVLSIVWWIVVVVAVLAIRCAEKKRQERVRTAFIATNYIYNSEAGLVTVGIGASPVDVLAAILSGLKYNFDILDSDDKDQVKFNYIVRTKKFETGNNEDQDKAASNTDYYTSAAQEEVITWEGEVLMVNRPDSDPLTFDNRNELLHILEGVPLPTTNSGSPVSQAVPVGA